MTHFEHSDSAQMGMEAVTGREQNSGAGRIAGKGRVDDASSAKTCNGVQGHTGSEGNCCGGADELVGPLALTKPDAMRPWNTGRPNGLGSAGHSKTLFDLGN